MESAEILAYRLAHREAQTAKARHEPRGSPQSTLSPSSEAVSPLSSPRSSASESSEDIEILRHKNSELEEKNVRLEKKIDDLERLMNCKFHALCKNLSACKSNSMPSIFGSRHHTYTPLAKQNPGLSCPRDLIPEGCFPPEPIEPEPKVGDIPQFAGQGGIFPANEVELGHFSHADILKMLNYYNETFEIQPGDNLQTRRSRINRWLKGNAVSI